MKINNTRINWCLPFQLLCLLILVQGCSSVTTILLVRHAEKGPGSNPSLNPAGKLRAQALVDVADQAEVSAIYTTQYLRTQQTAEPLANHLDLTPTIVSVGTDIKQYAENLTSNIFANYSGKTVVVVGHSNTVPQIIETFGISPPPTIPYTQYDRLFIVTKNQNGLTKLVKAQYGPE